MKNRINYYYENGKAVIEENGKKYDYFNPMNDIIFKSILKGDKNHIIVKNIAKELLKERSSIPNLNDSSRVMAMDVATLDVNVYISI